MKYRSSLQFREKHPQTVTPPPSNAVVPTIRSCRNAVFLNLYTRTRSSTGFNKTRLSSGQCTLCHDLIFHPIWSHGQRTVAVLCRIVSSGRFIGLLARNLALLRRLLTIHRLRSAFELLNSCCLTSLLRSLSSLGVVFQRLSCPLAFFCIPGLVHALLQSNNDRVAYIESFSRLSV
jgi:hypothetical protein